MGKEQFSFGKTMHATLQKLFALINEKKGLKQADLFGPRPTYASPLPTSPAPYVAGEEEKKVPSPMRNEWGRVREGELITFEEILKLYEQCWLDDWYESKKKKQERKEQGREILKVFYEKHKSAWPEVLFLEKKFNWKIVCDGASYAIRGAIDRIDAAAGGLKLVDYKTGQAKEKLSFEEKEQLFIYQLAATELFKEPVTSLVFYYLENNSAVEFSGTARDLEKIKAKIICTIKAVGRGEFPAKPGRICAWCDFNGICEYRGG